MSKWKEKKVPHLVVKAGAGTGKTTTLIEGIKYALGKNVTISPSNQQQAIWDVLKTGISSSTKMVMVAFNTDIVKELSNRIGDLAEAKTAHSLGNSFVYKRFGKLQLDQSRTAKLLAMELGVNLYTLRNNHSSLRAYVLKMVSLCKQTLTEPSSQEQLDHLADHYDVDVSSVSDLNRARELVASIYEQSKNVEQDNCIDFDDMIWLPIQLNLVDYRYDVGFIDEAQDLNRSRQELVLRACKRLILVGDPNQAIYGFTGADPESMETMKSRLEKTPAGVVVLPLNETRRCAKAIVKKANVYVKDFFAHPDNPEGAVINASYSQYSSGVAPGDMVVCRYNSPLVSECLRLISSGIPAKIIGKEIVEKLEALADKLFSDMSKDCVGTSSDYPLKLMVEAQKRVHTWVNDEKLKESSKPDPSTSALDLIQDRGDCLLHFVGSAKKYLEAGYTVIGAVKRSINSIFSDKDESSMVRLMTIHKSKGLENARVWILRKPTKSKRVPKQWVLTQERNLQYVAITRAAITLGFVDEGESNERQHEEAK